MTTFNDLGLDRMVVKAVAGQGYETPTPIQQQSIPILREGRDLLGIAQTGTGKTAAFTLPTLDKMARNRRKPEPKTVRVLVLAPTRELAFQIAESFRAYSKHMKCWVEVAVGGLKIGGQIKSLRRGTDVLVATPGRLVDLVEQKAVVLDQVETLILDEADHMLDLGFAKDLRKIMDRVPADRQSMLFSATMPKEIEALAKDYLSDPASVSVAPESTTAERVEQGVIHVKGGGKPNVLAEILRDESIDRVLVFGRTKHGCDAIVRQLAKLGIESAAIHGNKSQPQRTRALDAFKDGTCNVLVATDIAARGIDVRGISHVVNYDLPNVPEQYVHRIGRTARAGRDGVAISFCTAEDLYYLRDIEKITRQEIPVLDAPEAVLEFVAPTPDRNLRVPKPKGPAGRGRPQRSGSSQKPAAKKTGAKKPRSDKPAAKRPANANANGANKRRGGPRKPGGAAGKPRNRRPATANA